MLRKDRVRYDELASGRLVGEYDQNGALIQEIVYLGDIPVATIRTDQSGGTVGVFYIHTDHLNAPSKITRPSDNAVIWRWDHDPYGNGTPNQDPDGNGLLLTMNLRFPGQYADLETGLLYNMARDYDPATGRYIESDPIGLKAGVNTYSYVKGNPISNVDPTGTDIYCPSQTSVVDPVTHAITCVGEPHSEPPQCPNGDCAASTPETNCACVNDCMKRTRYAKFVCSVLGGKQACTVVSSMICTSQCKGQCDQCKK